MSESEPERRLKRSYSISRRESIYYFPCLVQPGSGPSESLDISSIPAVDCVGSGAKGGKMIKSSWFYVKFKYNEKVGHCFVFFPFLPVPFFTRLSLRQSKPRVVLLAVSLCIDS